jgi:hypothetical protein
MSRREKRDEKYKNATVGLKIENNTFYFCKG